MNIQLENLHKKGKKKLKNFTLPKTEQTTEKSIESVSFFHKGESPRRKGTHSILLLQLNLGLVIDSKRNPKPKQPLPLPIDESAMIYISRGEKRT